jgi:hypothetical protein
MLQMFSFVVKAVEVLAMFRWTHLRVSAMRLSVELLASIFSLFIIVVHTFFKGTPQKVDVRFGCLGGHCFFVMTLSLLARLLLSWL